MEFQTINYFQAFQTEVFRPFKISAHSLKISRLNVTVKLSAPVFKCEKPHAEYALFQSSPIFS